MGDRKKLTIMCPHLIIARNGTIESTLIPMSKKGKHSYICKLCKREIPGEYDIDEQIKQANDAFDKYITLVNDQKKLFNKLNDLLYKRKEDEMRKILDTPTEYSRLYDNLYGQFAKQKKYVVTDEYKSVLMDNIFTTLPENEQTAIKLITRGHSYDHAAKLARMDKKVLVKSYTTGYRHLQSPQNIAIAVNGYYDITSGPKTPLTEEDFGNRKYVLTALKKAGIIYREQLFKHLNNGWRYLWTIPGCGDGARQYILTAIDRWDGKVK